MKRFADEQSLRHLLHCRVTVFGFFLQRSGDHRAERLVDSAEIRRRRQVFHEDLAEAVAGERHRSGEKLEEDNPQGVDVDAPVVDAGTDLRRHVVDRTDTHGLAALAGGAYVLGQTVVADLDVALFEKDVFRFQVAMHDTPLVQVGEPLRNLADEIPGLLLAQTVR